MLKFIEADVPISEAHVQRVIVPEWEVAILQAIHQRAEVVRVGEKLVNRAAPDPGEEFRRLAMRYGTTTNEDGGKGPSFVSAVYGQFGATGALKKAIEDATVPDKVTVAATPAFGDLLGDEQQVSSVGG